MSLKADVSVKERWFGATRTMGPYFSCIFSGGGVLLVSVWTWRVLTVSGIYASKMADIL